MHSVLVDNSESQDRESQERSILTNTGPPTGSTSSSGYYNADKCRSYIANQIKVSKIDRIATQVCKAVEVEADIQSRLGNIMGMFTKRSAQVTHDFTLRCKLGLQRHRQDRILNQQRKPSKNNTTHPRYQDVKQYSISNDLLYGPGAQLVHTLLSQSMPFTTKHIKRKQSSIYPPEGAQGHHATQYQLGTAYLERSGSSGSGGGGLMEDDYLLSDVFEPALFVKKLEDSIKGNVRKSKTITAQLNTIGHLFERLASEHRDKVDIVYAAEEERQAATVIRRSAYNLSMAAIKATSTPVHVNSNNETY